MHYSSDTEEPLNLIELNQVLEVLQLITHRFSITAPDAGSHTSSTTPLSHTKSISLDYEYHGSFFERGFGKTERRRFPHKGSLTSPLKLLRQCHNECGVPAGRLSIRINYGDPTWTIMACIGTMSCERHSFDPFFSLAPIEAAIHVNDYVASKAEIDNRLEVLEEDVWQIIRKLRVDYQEDHPRLSRLEDMINRDMSSLRRHHLRAIKEVTEFWMARDIEEHPDETFGVPEQWTAESL
jgi:hypothetical protein